MPVSGRPVNHIFLQHRKKGGCPDGGSLGLGSKNKDRTKRATQPKPGIHLDPRAPGFLDLREGIEERPGGIGLELLNLIFDFINEFFELFN